MFDQPVGWQKSESRWCYGATILLYDGRFDKHSLGRNRSNSGRDDEIFQITQSLADNISLWQAIHNLSQAIHKQYTSMIPREIAFLLHLCPGLVWEANCTLSSLTGERERESSPLFPIWERDRWILTSVSHFGSSWSMKHFGWFVFWDNFRHLCYLGLI